MRAAHAYLETVKTAAQPEERAALQERAASELIRGGEIEAGFVLLREILSALELPMAQSPNAALLRLV